ncbi:MAG: hypothetical protein K2X74_19000 [Acetobacteraceae bacterium]|nr:hypothetical protein [Acetobacteraceae bacterium]
MSAPSLLSDAEKDALAERILNAMLKAGADACAGDMAFASLRALGAVLRHCALPGKEESVLRHGITFLEAEIELVQAGLSPPRQRLQ